LKVSNENPKHERLMTTFDINPTPSEAAMEYIRRKAVVSRDVWDAMVPELRAYAFTVSGVEAADTLQAMRDAIAAIPGGADYETVRGEVERLLNEALPPEPTLLDDPAEAEKRAAQMRRRAEFIVRSQVNAGYAAVAHKELSDYKDVFTHWRYITVGDHRVRESHAALDGAILPSTHEFWKTHFPPWEFGCRCQVVGITPREVDEVRAKEGGLKPERRTLIEGEELKRLEDERAVWREVNGVPKKISVAAPAERGDSNPWRFDPGDLSVQFADLRARYDETTWKLFEAWAHRAEIGDGRTVWEWLAGALNRGDERKPKSERAARAPKAADFEKAASRALRTAGVKTSASFKGAHVDVARQMSESIVEHARDYPEALARLEFFGTSAGQPAWVKARYEAEVRQWFESYYDYIPDPALRAKLIEKGVKRELSRKVARVNRAVAFVTGDKTRLVVNPLMTKDGPEVSESFKRATASGWWPRTVPEDKIYKAITDHEMGHAMHNACGAHNDPAMRSLYFTELSDATDAEARDKLSLYARTSLKEMIAESWAEFRNAAQPRELARTVSELLVRIYRARFPLRKNPNTTPTP
jgi:SPP1 gp7 family putative phage head morphogenesis protein